MVERGSIIIIPLSSHIYIKLMIFEISMTVFFLTHLLSGVQPQASSPRIDWTYCGWRKFCITNRTVNPINNGMFTTYQLVQEFAGPSTSIILNLAG